jgi:hypothetical protein
MLNFRAFYQPLGEGKSLGQAFCDWFCEMAPYSSSEVFWHYGMTITGDPLLVPVYSASLDITAPVVTVTNPPAGQTCTAGEILFIGWVASDENGLGSIAVSYSLNAGRDFTPIMSGETDDWYLLWTVPDGTPGSDSCVVRVEAWDPSGNVGTGYSEGYFTIRASVTGAGDTPLATALLHNYPNPFNGHTTVAYSLEETGRVSIRVYDTAGRLVRVLEDREREAGTYEAFWDGRDEAARPVASGIYLIRMDAGSYTGSRKIVYLR